MPAEQAPREDNDWGNTRLGADKVLPFHELVSPEVAEASIAFARSENALFGLDMIELDSGDARPTSIRVISVIEWAMRRAEEAGNDLSKVSMAVVAEELTRSLAESDESQ